MMSGSLITNNTQFDDFYLEYESTLKKFIKTRMKDHLFVDDMVQDVFVALLPYFKTVGDKFRLFGLAIGIGKRKVIDFYRLKENQTQHKIQIDDQTDLNSSNQELNLNNELINSILNELSAEQGTVLKLKYIENLSQNEIAEKLSKSPKAIESLLTRARENFKKLALRQLKKEDLQVLFSLLLTIGFIN